MFQIGDQVIYGIHGVCRVIDEEYRTVDRKRLQYLVLEPAGQTGSKYLVPTHSEVAMAKLRKMLSREELEALLCSDEVRSGTWITDENHRKQIYRELANCGDRTSVLKMVYILYQHRTEQMAAGRKVHQCDDNFLRDVERLLCSEISIVMDMEFEQARTYLREKLKRE